MSTPEIIQTDKVFDFRDLTDQDGNNLRHGIFVYRRRYSNNGHVHDWVFTSRNENPDATGVVANAIVIIARVGNKILIADEYRIPLQAREYGFPAGLCEAGQTFEQNGIRELREEGGLWATRIYPELTTGILISSAGLADEASKMIFVDAEGEVNHDLCEPTESIHAELMDFEKAMDIFHNKNLLLSAKTWGLMFGWWLAGELRFRPTQFGVSESSLPAGVPVVWTNKGKEGETFTIGGE